MEKRSYIQRSVAAYLQEREDLVAYSRYDANGSIEDINYRRVGDGILKSAAWFRANGISGRHIAIIAPNSYEWFITCFGIMATGNVVAALNPALPPELLAWQCATADVSIVCGPKAFLATLDGKLGNVEYLPFEQIQSETALTVEELHNSADDETVILLFTSGTTGVSKAVEITAGNLEHSIINMGPMFEAGYMDCAISTVPLYHIAGIRGGLAMLHYRKKICMGRGIMYLLMDMPVFNPSYILLVPVMVENIVKLLKRAKTSEQKTKAIGTNLKRITIAGAALKQETAQYLLEEGFMLDNVYAMTETTGDGTWCLLDANRTSSIGKASGQTECRVVNGEIQLKGPSVMKGYYKNPEETAKVMEEGWIHTGDVGYCDEDGYYYITGRLKNIIILSNGENICPEEIEAKLYSCEDVTECMVYGDGKGICADIFTAKEDVVAAYVKQYNEGVPMYRQIYKINYSAEPLEKTGSGKIKRKENVYV